jgi:hypothetical protein
VTLEFAPGAPAERFATLPAELSVESEPGLGLALLGSENLVVESLVVVPLADELPPPKAEPWTGSVNETLPESVPSAPPH